jgi:ankyrin repeat protein
MKIIKALFLLAAISLPMTAFAELTDDEYMQMTDALGTGNVKVVKKFLDTKAGANDLYFAWSALQIAANKGQLEVVKLLAEKGADLNYKHPLTKMTAIQLAAYGSYEDVVKYLATKGADVNTKMRGNVSIVRGLRDVDNTKMVNLLISLGAKEDGCLTEKCN